MTRRKDIGRTTATVTVPLTIIAIVTAIAACSTHRVSSRGGARLNAPAKSYSARPNIHIIASIAGTSTPTSCQPAFPNSPQNVPVTCLPTQSIYALTPKFKNEYTWNANLQVQQQLAKNDSLTLGYIMTNGRNLQFLRNSNLINPTSVLADGRPVFSTSVSAWVLVNRNCASA